MLARCQSVSFRVALCLQTFQPTLHPDSLTLGQSLTHPTFVSLEGRTCAVCGHNAPAGSRFKLSLQQQVSDSAHMASDAAAAEQEAIAAAQQAAAQAAAEAAVSSEDSNAAAAAAAAAAQQAAGAQQAAEAAGQDPLAAQAAQHAAASTAAAAVQLEAQQAAASAQWTQEVRPDAGDTASMQAGINKERSDAETAQHASPQPQERTRHSRNHHLVHPGGQGESPRV